MFICNSCDQWLDTGEHLSFADPFDSAGELCELCFNETNDIEGD